jgi:hypothetical protein
VLKYIRTTKTQTGLQVNARLLRHPYKKGEKISPQQMQQLALTDQSHYPTCVELHTDSNGYVKLFLRKP